MEQFILEYYQLYRFKFLGKIDGEYLKGKFIWDEETKEKIYKINEFEEAEEEQGRIWYLDEEGYRLEDENLFINSPWSIVEGEIRKNIIQRFMGDDGDATFALDSWVRIYDEYNTKK
jgi:hypothetical protein